MEMIENGVATNKSDTEWGHYTVWKDYPIIDWFIQDDGWNMTNFSNVRKCFK
jgi:hypothetical protein